MTDALAAIRRNQREWALRSAQGRGQTRYTLDDIVWYDEAAAFGDIHIPFPRSTGSG
jgi:hypothetical protein